MAKSRTYSRKRKHSRKHSRKHRGGVRGPQSGGPVPAPAPVPVYAPVHAPAPGPAPVSVHAPGPVFKSGFPTEKDYNNMFARMTPRNRIKYRIKQINTIGKKFRLPDKLLNEKAILVKQFIELGGDYLNIFRD